jgi:hypothetical protein
MDSNGGMVLTGESRRTRRKACPNATLSIKNLTGTDPSVNSGLCESKGEVTILAIIVVSFHTQKINVKRERESGSRGRRVRKSVIS